MKAVFAFLLIACIAGSAGAQQYHASSALPAGGASLNKVLLLQLVNAVRKKGCSCGGEWFGPAPELSWNKELETAAAGHSLDMMQHHYFSHTSADGTNAGQRLQQAGYQWRTYGENIAEGYTDEQAVVDGWISSPGHCRNIMNKDFLEMGVGRAGAYWTQTFGARLK